MRWIKAKLASFWPRKMDPGPNPVPKSVKEILDTPGFYCVACDGYGENIVTGERCKPCFGVGRT